MTPSRWWLFGLLLIPGLVTATSTIAVLGDSLSAAFGIEPDQGWVQIVAQRLRQQHYQNPVFNASISGETSAGGRQRINALLDQQQPAYLILALGANDGLRGLPLKQLQHNLEQIIKISQQRGVRVILVGMRLPTNYGLDYSQRFNATFRHLADQFKLPLVPFLLAGLENQPRLFQADGLHPTAQAQPLIAENVWPVLIAALERDNINN